MNIPVTVSPAKEGGSAPAPAPAPVETRAPSLTRRLLAWLAVLLATAAIAGGLGYYKYGQITAATAASSAMPEPSEHVEAVRVRRGEWADISTAVGTVVSQRRVEVRNELPGTVVHVGFRSGDIVEEGQELLRLDSREDEAALDAAQAAAQLARMTFDRRQTLRSGQTVSEESLDEARAQLGKAEAQVHALEVAIGKKTIHAPFRGKVGLTDLQPGAYLEAGSPIAVLQGVGPDAYVDFALPQGKASALSTGQSVTLTGPEFKDGRLEVTIVASDAEVDGSSRAVRFRALARDVGETLRPGSFVDVEATIAPPRPALFVPLTAVRRASFGEHVFLLSDEDGALRGRQRIVRTGPVVGQEIVVLDGLAEGELIAGAGSFKLREGLLVQADPSGGASPER